MFQRFVCVSFLVISIVCCAAAAFAGKVELTTYYPAPYGEYKNLTSTQDASFATTSGYKVGIGTATPQRQLEVVSPSDATRISLQTGIKANNDDSASIEIRSLNTSIPFIDFVSNADPSNYGAPGDRHDYDARIWYSSADSGANTLTLESSKVAIVKREADAGTAALDVAGSVKIGDTATTCNASAAGMMRYEGGQMQFCNGTAWTTIGGGLGFCTERLGNGSMQAMPDGRYEYQAYGGGWDFAVVCKGGQLIGWCHYPSGGGNNFTANSFTCG